MTKNTLVKFILDASINVVKEVQYYTTMKYAYKPINDIIFYITDNAFTGTNLDASHAFKYYTDRNVTYRFVAMGNGSAGDENFDEESVVVDGGTQMKVCRIPTANRVISVWSGKEYFLLL
jgi:hypothetical protein